MPVAPSLAHMVGVVAVINQVAEGALKQVQDRAAAGAMRCIDAVQSAAASAADQAADVLASVAKPTDGVNTAPGPSMFKLGWDVSDGRM